MSNIFSSGGSCISIYPTPQSMQNKCDEYFDMCFTTTYSKTYDRYIPKVVVTPTVSGLARYLGFRSRGQLLNYVSQRDDTYGDIVADAMLRIEDFLEQELVHSKAPAGIIFSLKNNAGWEDKTKQQLVGLDDKPIVYGWADNAQDVIEISAGNNAQNKAPLPPAPPQIESTQENDGSIDF